MNNTTIKIFLGIISILIIKEYIEIILSKREIRHKKMFWSINILMAVLLETNSGIPLINLTLNYIFIFIVCVIGYQGRIIGKILVAVSMIVIWAITEIVILYMAMTFHIYLVIPEIQGSILSKLFTLLFVELIKYTMKYHNINSTAGKVKTKYEMILITIPLCSMAIIYYIYFLVGNTREPQLLLRAMLSSVLFLPLNLILFKVYDLLYDKFELEKQNIIYEQSLNLIQDEIKEKTEMMASKQLLHDCKNHFFVIKNISEQHKYIEVLEYINQIQEKYKLNIVFINSGNIVIDAMINSKCSREDYKEIECNYDIIVPEQMDFEDADLCILLGNALDNAFRAAKNAVKKQVEIVIQYSRKRLIIGIKNTYSGVVEKDSSGNYITTQNDKKQHGLGILLIKKVIDKYEGFLELDNDNTYFIFLAVLKELNNNP